MPFYNYIDRNTGEKFELLMTVAEMSAKQSKSGTIVHDGKILHRDIASEHRGFSGTPSNWPMLSDSAGVHPSQVGAAFKESVGIGVPTRFHPETGQAIFESRAHRKAFLKAKGMYDRNGGYGD